MLTERRTLLRRATRLAWLSGLALGIAVNRKLLVVDVWPAHTATTR